MPIAVTKATIGQSMRLPPRGYQQSRDAWQDAAEQTPRTGFDFQRNEIVLGPSYLLVDFVDPHPDTIAPLLCGAATLFEDHQPAFVVLNGGRKVVRSLA